MQNQQDPTRVVPTAPRADTHLMDDPAAAKPALPEHAPVIQLSGVGAQYAPGVPTVLDIDTLTVCQGERIALIGPSGAGKTTLLRLLNGYVQPTRGRIRLFDRELDLDRNRNRKHLWAREDRVRIGFIFQDFSLIERATVFQNVLWGRLGRLNRWASLLGLFSATDKQMAMAAIDEVDLLAQANQRVDTLSGGQQQRVGVARVLAQEAEIILADEPVSNLDPALADDVLGLLADVCRRRNATLLMSLHQPRLAKEYADRIIGLANGRIIYDRPSCELDPSAIHEIYGRELRIDPTLSLLNGPDPSALEPGS